MQQVVITPDLQRQLERRKQELQHEMEQLGKEFALVVKKLEAIPLFLPSANGTSEEPKEEQAPTSHRVNVGDAVNPRDFIDAQESPSAPMAVKLALQERPRMTAVEIRNAITKLGIPKERLGLTGSYLYTVLGRLMKKGEIQRIRGKYQLPPGVAIQYKPDEEDLRKP